MNPTTDHDLAKVAGMAWAYGREHIHDACMTPRDGDIKYVDGVECVFEGSRWRSTGKEVAGPTNTPRAGELEGSRDRTRAMSDPPVYQAVVDARKAAEGKLGTLKAAVALSNARAHDKARLETDSEKRKEMPRFSHERFATLIDETVVTVKKLGHLKGGEYSGDVDRLENFRRNGEALGLPMEAIWHTYTAKHWDAVTQHIKDIVHGKERERLEPLSGRLDDIILYCILFKAMLIEREQTK
jgi:hypothetical protein